MAMQLALVNPALTLARQLRNEAEMALNCRNL